jgi:hypothetical protein
MRFAVMGWFLLIASFDGAVRRIDSGLPCREDEESLGSPPASQARKESAMIEILVATGIGLLLVVGPLAWRVLRDRSEAKALSTRAYVQSLVDRKLGGESFVSVQVTPRGVWSLGQVVVSVPGGWEWMLEGVWPVLMARVPRGYELVVRRGEEAPAPARPLRRVA